MTTKRFLKTFDELSIDQLYKIMKHRSNVFFLEQSCQCEDLDDKDQIAQHLWLENSAGELVAYARLFLPNQVYAESSIGRVLVPKAERGKGFANTLTEEAIHILETLAPGVAIRLSAQLPVEAFYQRFGFQSYGEVYDECGIAHIGMIRDA
ncbi:MULTISPECIES: GNAT family N-acetyltransferase [unclassified Marinobacterium]|uniref:GNAT family N-acetyltransferase n=1 Tax=unclassified Marinobacterium TaxID=2644139 RepID=UPI0015685844|nr:putative acyltransferase [Marinobacterium sp. xm-g-48]NRP28237.1 putative acyltransferase [Marinobacterium sp. xm-d-420]NRP38023.1 putative acyltransferase [Marinobacterium sp. xm-a-121]NRP53740.1 putative acyltransferase [Marinobacterium sp. xm-v-242]NRP56150.1 putative acyltransferase [Marinobacterium sp. xm-d-510]NRP58869.1 putative acyltransferase [Marinobacterium sp. xm-d-564]NRP78238.1 putative acyltransferase [Marinobacterium sp. xm-m-383]NRP81792.1 putative acyltransferase [Marino